MSGPETNFRKTLNRAGKKKTRVHYSADFETTTTADDCRVWVWGLMPVDDTTEFEWGKDIESWAERAQQHNSVQWFFNLKFDGHFIIDYLLKQGYCHTTERVPKPGEFTTLISNMGKFYSMNICWDNGHVTEFRDAAKKVAANMSVARVAKAYKLDEGKGEIDYHKPREVGYTPDAEELDYLRRDVKIVAQVIALDLEQGMTRLTIGSDALAEYKATNGEKWFSRTFPVLSEAMDAEIRRAYRGGFTYADERFKGELQGNGLVLDVNSLYPSIMMNRYIPYGEPEFVEGRVEPTERRPLTIFSVTFTATLKPGHIPCIQIKNSGMFAPTEYLKVIEDPTTLMVTNVDWALYQDHYDITVLSYGGGWRFKAAMGMFDRYINKWMEVKANSEGGMREIAKLYLNSLYGKFATNPQVASKIPYLGDNGEVRYTRGDDERRPPVYTAAGVFITSWARDLTIRAAQANYDTFAYADTDSLHLLTDTIPADIDVHPSRLGAWKLEYHFEEAFYVRAKFYLEKKHKPVAGCPKDCDGTYHNAIAGIPALVSSKLTFSDLIDGRIVEGKLQPKSVPGGLVLNDVPFTIKM